jgi:hypothetical protein
VYVYIATKLCVLLYLRSTQWFTVMSTLFWEMTPCSPVEIYRHLILSSELLQEHGIESQQAIQLTCVFLLLVWFMQFRWISVRCCMVTQVRQNVSL